MVKTAAYAIRSAKLAVQQKALEISLVIVTDRFTHLAYALPLAITPSPGQASDKALGPRLAAHHAPGDVVADRGCDSRAIFGLVCAHGGRGHIPTRRGRKAQRPVDDALDRQRSLIERLLLQDQPLPHGRHMT